MIYKFIRSEGEIRGIFTVRSEDPGDVGDAEDDAEDGGGVGDVEDPPDLGPPRCGRRCLRYVQRRVRLGAVHVSDVVQYRVEREIRTL